MEIEESQSQAAVMSASRAAAAGSRNPTLAATDRLSVLNLQLQLCKGSTRTRRCRNRAGLIWF